MGEQKHSTKKSIKLDEVSKTLFDPANPMTIDWINSLFDESYDKEAVEVFHGPKELINEDYKLTRPDVSIEVFQDGRRAKYHIEFQTDKDNLMVLRMVKYGFGLIGKEELGEGSLLEFPKQRVIYLEENSNIPDVLNQKFRMEDGSLFDYQVKVIKNWELSLEEIEEKRLYPFISLQLNNYRKALKRAEGNGNLQEIQRLFSMMLDESKRLMKQAGNFLYANKITEADYTAIMNGIQYMVEHLNRIYLNDDEIEEGVSKMTKVYVDETIKENAVLQTKVEFVQNMLAEGLSDEIIKKVTMIDDRRLAEIKEQYRKGLN